MSKEKVNPNYGYVFHDLREQRGFKQTDFQAVGLSASSISDFEAGKTILRYDKLLAALQLIHIEIGEYDYFVNDFQEDYYTRICKTISKAYHEQNIKLLQSINDEAKLYDNELGNRLIYLATQNLLGQLTDEEENEITDYLFDISEWSYFELSILSFVVEHLNTRTKLSLLNDFWDANRHYLKVARYRERILEIVFRASISYIAQGQKEIAQIFLEKAEKVLRNYEKDLYLQVVFSLIQGLWVNHFKDKGAGEQQMLETIHIFEEEHDESMKNFSIMIYQRFAEK